jgi:hypothetical protein
MPSLISGHVIKLFTLFWKNQYKKIFKKFSATAQKLKPVCEIASNCFFFDNFKTSKKSKSSSLNMSNFKNGFTFLAVADNFFVLIVIFFQGLQFEHNQKMFSNNSSTKNKNDIF